MLNLSLAFLVVALAAGAVALMFRDKLMSRRLHSPRRPQHRHIVVRIICACLAAAILAGIAVGTFRTVRASYAEPTGSDLAIRVPTLPLPAPPALSLGQSREQITDLRVLATVVLIDLNSAGFQPVGAKQRDIRLPRDSNTVLEWISKDPKFEFRFTLADVWVERSSDNSSAILKGTYSRSVSWDIAGRSSSSSSGTLELPATVLVDAGILDHRPSDDFNPLSIGISIQRRYMILTFLSPVANDDPLMEASLTRFLESQNADINAGLQREGAAPRVASPQTAQHPSGGTALVAYAGSASLLLLLAAVLLAQVFKRRELAFAGMLAAVVLYVAALDYFVLQYNTNRLADRNAPVAVRMTAATLAGQTFFWRGRAMYELREIANVRTEPAPLRQQAETVDRLLSDAR